MNRLREYENKAVRKTLLSSYCPPLIRDARERQDAYLREKLRGRSGAIADIGCGDGYHAVLFQDVWHTYHGFEIATEIAAIARDKWKDAGLSGAQLFEGDVTQMQLPEQAYDIVFCLYFTPGNFRDRAESLSVYDKTYLDHNPAFIRLIARFWNRLLPGGQMFLTVYKDVVAAETAQIDFYKKTGQHVITPPGSRFVATAENFWSVRWTKISMLSNLKGAGVDERHVVFYELNEIAWLVIVTRPMA